MEHNNSSKNSDADCEGRTDVDYNSSSKDSDADREESTLAALPGIIGSMGTQKSGRGIILSPLQRTSKRPTNTRVIQLLKRPRTVVNHSYVDYSLVPYHPRDNALPKSIDEMDFHQKLHLILSHPEARDFAAWLPHGRAFKIINPTKFEKIICPKYFGHKRYSSFLNHVGVNGFKIITQASYRNSFYSQVSFATKKTASCWYVTESISDSPSLFPKHLFFFAVQNSSS